MDEKKEIKLAGGIQSVLEKNPYIQFLGVEFLKLQNGYALARMKYREELANHYGTLHGGSLYSLADIIAGAAACMGGFYVTTVSGTMNFLLPAKGSEYVFCEAVRLRGGKHLSVFEVRIKDEEDRILDSGEFTFFVTAKEILDTGATKDAQG